ncbi:MAG: amidophosphoribosyltransferase [Acidobacteria bacterium]|nr:amidophosphoribosyltransferase [Acidobacteriota bacterium]
MSALFYSHDDHFHDECGVFAVYGHPEAAKLTYLGLYALQHRGQESAGIVSSDGRELRHHKGMGYVAEVFTELMMGTLEGHAAIGHTRYSTAGETTLANAQPLVVTSNKGPMALGHNGNLVNAQQVRRRLEAAGSIFQTTSDTEVIVHLLAQSRKESLREAIPEALRQVEGAYSLVMLTRDAVFAIRDPRGFRPLCLGQLDGAWVVGSETCAFDLIGAEYIREVEPGEMVMLSEKGVESGYYSPPMKHSCCIFEHVYFSRPDSVIFGRPVQKSREMLGRLLAREHPADADIVVPVPDSGTAAAIGYSVESGIPLKVALIRNHYIGRTFIQPEQSIRDFNVRVKLNPVRSLLENKRVILVDDSIVRGTTMRKIVHMIRGAGALAVHVRISCPPIVSPCFYGIDTPTKRELIGSHKNVEEISTFIEADSLGYLSREGMRKAVADAEGRYCTACYTGKYPTDFVELQLQAEEAAANKTDLGEAFSNKRARYD